MPRFFVWFVLLLFPILLLAPACQEEPCSTDPNGDVDKDGICGDQDNCPDQSNSDQADKDKDGIGDLCDTCPKDSQNDIDKDGLCADLDNCPSSSNSNQADSDNDGTGDACEFPTCDQPGTCGSGFPSCNNNSGCQGNCVTVAEGGGLCVQNFSCTEENTCPNGTVDCPVGAICVVQSCCQDPICIFPQDFCPSL